MLNCHSKPSLSPCSLSVLDWLVQPKPRWLGGNGWLLDGPEEVLQGTCHGSPSQSQPLFLTGLPWVAGMPAGDSAWFLWPG